MQRCHQKLGWCRLREVQRRFAQSKTMRWSRQLCGIKHLFVMHCTANRIGNHWRCMLVDVVRDRYRLCAWQRRYRHTRSQHRLRYDWHLLRRWQRLSRRWQLRSAIESERCYVWGWHRMLVGHLLDVRSLLCNCMPAVRHLRLWIVCRNLHDCWRLHESDVSCHHLHRHSQRLQRRCLREVHWINDDWCLSKRRACMCGGDRLLKVHARQRTICHAFDVCIVRLQQSLSGWFGCVGLHDAQSRLQRRRRSVRWWQDMQRHWLLWFHKRSCLRYCGRLH